MANGKDQVTYFAETDFRKRTPFGIKAIDRTKHVYVIGKTGMGKSTLLENMAIQDIQNGNGLAFVDPHGKTAEYLLDFVPKERVDDVVYFAPFDMDNPISFNIMEDVGYDKRHLVVAGLMSAFKKIWVDAWSARMEYILSNTLLALLEYPDSTLLGVNRMLVDKAYRKKVVDNVTDPTTKSFWVDEFAKYTDRYTMEATPAIQNKVGQFTSNPLVRNIIGQPKSSFDLRQMMDDRKILIINLAKGRIGEGNANLLGSMLITKLYLSAMSRADANDAELSRLPNFYLFVDEFQSFANESFADILSEARKYKLNLTMAHQYIEQMSDEVRAAVFGNVGTMISFRVGAYDAEILEKEYAPRFIADDMVNLGFAQIYLKLMIDGVSSQPFSATTLPPIEIPPRSYRAEVIAQSQKQFSKPRVEVQKSIDSWFQTSYEEPRKPAGTAPTRRLEVKEVSPAIRTQAGSSAGQALPSSAVSRPPRSDNRQETPRGDDRRKQNDRRQRPERRMEPERRTRSTSPTPGAEVSLKDLKRAAIQAEEEKLSKERAESGNMASLKDALAAVLEKERAAKEGDSTKSGKHPETKQAIDAAIPESDTSPKVERATPQTKTNAYTKQERRQGERRMAANPQNVQQKETSEIIREPQTQSARTGEVPEDVLRNVLEGK